MIAERATEADVVDAELDVELDEMNTEIDTEREASVHGVTEWLDRRPDLRRPFVANYQPRHRAERVFD